MVNTLHKDENCLKEPVNHSYVGLNVIYNGNIIFCCEF